MTNQSVIKPIYQQISIDIANRIAKGEFPVGSKIYGRSSLAGQYNVSPETIRRAVILLEDVGIVQIVKGSGILVKSRDEAFKYIEKFKGRDSISSLKKEIELVLLKRKTLDDDLIYLTNKLIDSSVRFKNTNPFAPLEVEILPTSKLIGKTIAEVNFWQNTGATIIGIRRNHDLILSPGPYAVFTPEDIIILIGEENTYHRVKEFFDR